MSQSAPIKIYLVRHGEAAAGWGQASDPGLSDLGRQQAGDTADYFHHTQSTPLPLLSSPLMRAQETAAPLADSWGQSVTIEPRIAEIPKPPLSLDERGPWLHSILRSQWSEVPEALQQWRMGIVQTLLEQRESSVLFTHFVVINAVVSHLRGSDDVVCFHPDNCSITELQLDGGELALLATGREAETKIN